MWECEVFGKDSGHATVQLDEPEMVDRLGHIIQQGGGFMVVYDSDAEEQTEASVACYGYLNLSIYEQMIAQQQSLADLISHKLRQTPPVIRGIQDILVFAGRP